MAYETMWKPVDVEKIIKDMTLFWDSSFGRELIRRSQSIDIVATKEIVVKKVNVSKAIKRKTTR